MIESDEEAPQAWDESPAMPPEGDPSYSPAIHGARSREHLRELVEQGFKSDAGQNAQRQRDAEHLQELIQEGVNSGYGKTYKNSAELFTEINEELDTERAQ